MLAYAPSVSNWTGDVLHSPDPAQRGQCPRRGWLLYARGHPSGPSFIFNSHDPKAQAHANWGEIRMKYNSMGSERSFLGWPREDVKLGLRDNGSCQYFAGGAIYSHPRLGTFAVMGSILTAYADQKWETGKLGYPISDYIPDGGNGPVTKNNLQVVAARGGGIQKFQHGYVRLSGLQGWPLKWCTTVNLYSARRRLPSWGPPAPRLPPILRVP
jgi:hypothetical protein